MPKGTRQARPPAGTADSPPKKADTAVDAEAQLRADHRKAEQVFKLFETEEDAGRKKELARQACRELIVHAMLEEEIFYPACREKGIEADLLDEAQVEHDTLKLLIGDLLGREPGSEFFDAKVAVLAEYVKHHVQEEEKPFSGIFAKARQGGVDMDELGTRLKERKQQLVKQCESGEIEAPAPRSIRNAPDAPNRNREEADMAREFDRDRDEDRGFGPEDGRGRFGGRYTREQDPQTGGRQYPRGGYSRYQGVGGTRDWYEPEQGRGGYPGRRDYLSGSGRQEDDFPGSRRGYGDSRGDSGYGSFEREDADYRYGMGDRDRGRMSSGRTDRDEDYSDLGRRSRFGGGRYNEHGGHPADDDFRGGDRSGFPRERDEYGRFVSDDDDGGERGRPRRHSNDEDRGGRGQGGWFGDSRGHAEAARRGWRNRD